MQDSTNKILVPIDFSEQSMIALSQSYNLAKRIEAEIILLYVLEDLNPMVKMLYKELGQIKGAVENNLKDLVELKRSQSGLNISYKLVEGKIYNQIVEVAKAENVSVIVMGTKGNQNSKFIGSNANKVVKTAPCPVISIKGKEHREGCDKVLLPLDLTKETKDKTQQAIEVAKLFGSEIFIVSMLQTDKEEVVEHLKNQLLEVQAKIEGRGVKCTSDLVDMMKKDEPLAIAVINYAKRIDADLIMIMTQQEVDNKLLFIGSKAKAVINNSDIPVLSILPNKG